jgi:succinate dehydrogenase / fumarate reductase membrane anchor subunit
MNLKSSAKGHSVWRHQRVTAIILLLSLCFILVTLCCQRHGTGQELLHWLHHPASKAFAFIALNTLFYHSFLGIKMVLEDYIHLKAIRQACLFISFILHLFFAAFGSILILF